MRVNNQFESDGLAQVWAWKDAVHNSVAHLSLADAMREIQQRAKQAADKHPEVRRVASRKDKRVHTGLL